MMRETLCPLQAIILPGKYVAFEQTTEGQLDIILELFNNVLVYTVTDDEECCLLRCGAV
jgi:hypothetical protein